MERQIKKRGWFFFRAVAAVTVFSAGAAAAIFVFILYTLADDLPSPESITERSVMESTKLYDRSGKIVLYEIHGPERRTIVPLKDIPERIKWATIAAEDINFYRHKGLEWRGILRAVFVNIAHWDIRQGGSTITQQLVKNSLLNSERTFTRKFKEGILTLLIEHKYSKDQILELYLNQIPYGSSAYGVASAANIYFDKKPEELTLEEAAALAALPKAPTYYSPYGSHKDELLKRKDWILDRMALETGTVSPEEAKRAQGIPLLFSPAKESIRAPHFVMYVREYLNERYGEEFVEQKGLKVITTLDMRLQEKAEELVKREAEKNEKKVNMRNAALVAIDPASGEILAMVGSRDYFGAPLPENCIPGVNCKFDPFVNATLRPRQPGSAFKPFVYATALKKGYTPETILFDVPTEFNPTCTPDGNPGDLTRESKCYHPQNYDESFRGPVSLRRSLGQSLNIPAVKVLYLADIYDVLETAKNLGITTLNDPGRYGLSLVLGGGEVTLLEMTSAYGAFANDGIWHPKTAILRIEDKNGAAIEEKKHQPLPGIDTEVARTMNDILSDNDARIPVFHPRSPLYFSDRKVAAKTGTTQDYRDAWVIGYTPSLVVGVWAGNNDNTPLNRSALSVMVAAPLWHDFLAFALEGSPPEDFIPPEKKDPEKPVFRGHFRGGDTVKIDRISQKLATEFTPPDLVEEVSFGPVLSILGLADRKNPLGPPPADPLQDPQFANWQAGIDGWIQSHPLPVAEPPKESDDIHTPEKKPKIEISFRENNDKENKLIESVEVSIKKFFPLREIQLFIDEELKDSQSSSFSSDTVIFRLAEPLGTGRHLIEVVVYDIAGNREEAAKEIETQPPPLSSQ
jgi:penicillin-binding protein 1C